MSKSHKSSSPTPIEPSAANAPLTVEVKAGVFKNTCLELMDDVHAHRKEVVITKHGTPVAKLIAPDTQAPSAFGFMRGTLLAHGDIVSPDLEPWGEFGA